MFKAVIIAFLTQMCFQLIQAQTPVSNSFPINVKARVVSDVPVEITTLQHMTVSRALGADSGALYISPINSSSAGLMQAKGRPGTLVRMEYVIHEELPEENRAGTIRIRYEMSGNKEMVQAASQLIDTGEFEFNLNNDGVYFLWLGGWVHIEEAAPGTYKGEFNIEIQYI